MCFSLIPLFSTILIQRLDPKLTLINADVDDSSEAIQDFQDSGNDTRPSEYITNIALSDAEKDNI